MYVIIGFRMEPCYGDRGNGYEGWAEYHEENVCTFDKKEDARRYINQSKLKSRKNRWPAFKERSLLRMFESASIEEYVPEVIPHNPVYEGR